MFTEEERSHNTRADYGVTTRDAAHAALSAGGTEKGVNHIIIIGVLSKSATQISHHYESSAVESTSMS